MASLRTGRNWNVTDPSELLKVPMVTIQSELSHEAVSAPEDHQTEPHFVLPCSIPEGKENVSVEECLKDYLAAEISVDREIRIRNDSTHQMSSKQSLTDTKTRQSYPPIPMSSEESFTRKTVQARKERS